MLNSVLVKAIYVIIVFSLCSTIMVNEDDQIFACRTCHRAMARLAAKSALMPLARGKQLPSRRLYNAAGYDLCKQLFRKCTQTSARRLSCRALISHNNETTHSLTMYARNLHANRKN